MQNPLRLQATMSYERECSDDTDGACDSNVDQSIPHGLDNVFTTLVSEESSLISTPPRLQPNATVEAEDSDQAIGTSVVPESFPAQSKRARRSRGIAGKRQTKDKSVTIDRKAKELKTTPNGDGASKPTGRVISKLIVATDPVPCDDIEASSVTIGSEIQPSPPKAHDTRNSERECGEELIGASHLAIIQSMSVSTCDPNNTLTPVTSGEDLVTKVSPEQQDTENKEKACFSNGSGTSLSVVPESSLAQSNKIIGSGPKQSARSRGTTDESASTERKVRRVKAVSKSDEAIKPTKRITSKRRKKVVSTDHVAEEISCVSNEKQVESNHFEQQDIQSSEIEHSDLPSDATNSQSFPISTGNADTASTPLVSGVPPSTEQVTQSSEEHTNEPSATSEHVNTEPSHVQSQADNSQVSLLSGRSSRKRKANEILSTTIKRRKVNTVTKGDEANKPIKGKRGKKAVRTDPLKNIAQDDTCVNQQNEVKTQKSQQSKSAKSAKTHTVTKLIAAQESVVFDTLNSSRVTEPTGPNSLQPASKELQKQSTHEARGFHQNEDDYIGKSRTGDEIVQEPMPLLVTDSAENVTEEVLYSTPQLYPSVSYTAISMPISAAPQGLLESAPTAADKGRNAHKSLAKKTSESKKRQGKRKARVSPCALTDTPTGNSLELEHSSNEKVQKTSLQNLAVLYEENGVRLDSCLQSGVTQKENATFLLDKAPASSQVGEVVSSDGVSRSTLESQELERSDNSQSENPHSLMLEKKTDGASAVNSVDASEQKEPKGAGPNGQSAVCANSLTSGSVALAVDTDSSSENVDACQSTQDTCDPSVTCVPETQDSVVGNSSEPASPEIPLQTLQQPPTTHGEPKNAKSTGPEDEISFGNCSEAAGEKFLEGQDCVVAETSSESPSDLYEVKNAVVLPTHNLRQGRLKRLGRKRSKHPLPNLFLLGKCVSKKHSEVSFGSEGPSIVGRKKTAKPKNVMSKAKYTVFTDTQDKPKNSKIMATSSLTQSAGSVSSTDSDSNNTKFTESAHLSSVGEKDTSEVVQMPVETVKRLRKRSLKLNRSKTNGPLELSKPAALSLSSGNVSEVNVEPSSRDLPQDSEKEQSLVHAQETTASSNTLKAADCISTTDVPVKQTSIDEHSEQNSSDVEAPPSHSNCSDPLQSPSQEQSDVESTHTKHVLNIRACSLTQEQRKDDISKGQELSSRELLEVYQKELRGRRVTYNDAPKPHPTRRRRKRISSSSITSEDKELIAHNTCSSPHDAESSNSNNNSPIISKSSPSTVADSTPSWRPKVSTANTNGKSIPTSDTPSDNQSTAVNRRKTGGKQDSTFLSLGHTSQRIPKSLKSKNVNKRKGPGKIRKSISGNESEDGESAPTLHGVVSPSRASVQTSPQQNEELKLRASLSGSSFEEDFDSDNGRLNTTVKPTVAKPSSISSKKSSEQKSNNTGTSTDSRKATSVSESVDEETATTLCSAESTGHSPVERKPQRLKEMKMEDTSMSESSHGEDAEAASAWVLDVAPPENSSVKTLRQMSDKEKTYVDQSTSRNISRVKDQQMARLPLDNASSKPSPAIPAQKAFQKIVNLKTVKQARTNPATRHTKPTTTGKGLSKNIHNAKTISQEQSSASEWSSSDDSMGGKTARQPSQSSKTSTQTRKRTMNISDVHSSVDQTPTSTVANRVSSNNKPSSTAPLRTKQPATQPKPLQNAATLKPPDNSQESDSSGSSDENESGSSTSDHFSPVRKKLTFPTPNHTVNSSKKLTNRTAPLSSAATLRRPLHAVSQKTVRAADVKTPTAQPLAVKRRAASSMLIGSKRTKGNNDPNTGINESVSKPSSSFNHKDTASESSSDSDSSTEDDDEAGAVSTMGKTNQRKRSAQSLIALVTKQVSKRPVSSNPTKGKLPPRSTHFTSQATQKIFTTQLSARKSLQKAPLSGKPRSVKPGKGSRLLPKSKPAEVNLKSLSLSKDEVKLSQNASQNLSSLLDNEELWFESQGTA